MVFPVRTASWTGSRGHFCRPDRTCCHPDATFPPHFGVFDPLPSCHAGCCRSFVVPLTGQDIRRLAAASGRPLWDFACRWDDEDSALPEEFAPRLTFPTRPADVCPRRQTLAERGFPGHGPLRVSDGNRDETSPPTGATPRCPLHRPMFHPLGTTGSVPTVSAEVGAGGNHEQRELPQHGRATSESAYKLCPRDWTPTNCRPFTRRICTTKSLANSSFGAKSSSCGTNRAFQPNTWKSSSTRSTAPVARLSETGIRAAATFACPREMDAARFRPPVRFQPQSPWFGRLLSDRSLKWFQIPMPDRSAPHPFEGLVPATGFETASSVRPASHSKRSIRWRSMSTTSRPTRSTGIFSPVLGK